MVPKKFARFLTDMKMSLFYKRWTPKRIMYALGFLFFFLSAIFLYISVYKLELWPWYPSVDRWCDVESAPEYMLRPSPDEMTIVTMFLDLGVLKNGNGWFSYRSPYSYRRWMRIFGRMANRVVAYMENDEDVEYFRKIRSCLPPSLTKIIKIHRNELPSFKHLPQIKNIYSRQSYPKHFPNTVYPEYTCAMYAKFDVLSKALDRDYFQTPYFAWMDIGLFRRMDGTDQGLFKLVPPAKFNPERIGMSQVWPLDPVQPLEDVMKKRMVWVSGSMVLATKEYMANFTQEYKEAVEKLLKLRLANSDQEVIYSMYTVHMRKPTQVRIKTYLCYQGQLGLTGSDSRYFCLGYVCKNAWDKRVPHLQT